MGFNFLSKGLQIHFTFDMDVVGYDIRMSLQEQLDTRDPEIHHFAVAQHKRTFSNLATDGETLCLYVFI